MKKLLAILFFVLLFLFSTLESVFAEGEFFTDTTVFYDIEPGGNTLITHYITLENALTDIYATNYGLTIYGSTPSDISGFIGNKKLPVVVSRQEGSVTATVAFDDAVVGKGEKRQFSISYKDRSIVTKSGEVWEVVIPKLTNNKEFRHYAVQLSVPTNLGEAAYISPTPSERSTLNDKSIYKFTKNQIQDVPITAAFGKFQVFSFDLTYHLENPLHKGAYTEIALPPDTQYQKVILSKLDPEPSEVNVDNDGNWIAKYIMSPRQRIDVRAQGSVQIFAEKRYSIEPSDEVLAASLQQSPVWQIGDPKIKELAMKLKTPRAIYDYVVSTLSYDYDRVKPNVTRYGAVEALANPKNAICMEFTDLFIALARAAGIPAREVNGFAYTENAQLQPLSLVADVLHAWPEYWDKDKKAWISIDPTWGNTTGGGDFFNKLDLRHFAFAIHGSDPYLPYPAGSYKLGSNPQKDVYVSFGELPQNRDGKISLFLFSGNYGLFSPSKNKIRVKNVGSSSIGGQNAHIYFDNQEEFVRKIPFLPPFAQFDIEVEIPFNLLGYKVPEHVTITAGDQSLTIQTHRERIILANVAFIFICFAAVLLILLLLLRKKIFIRKYALLPNIQRFIKRSA